ncbi:anhydro-N-acetylmuramic acid kinase [Streptomyces sp. NPDC048420]|uniref:anhydro-N-acetylmuramic acid kinase n=1 Tax=Streptomyces sp. NPDC048420 TaxID=3155755 RepID=UPI0034291A21
MSAEDVVAALTFLTARTVADAVRAADTTEEIASGGGTRDPVLMGTLGELLPGIAPRASDALGSPSCPGGGGTWLPPPARERRVRLVLV